MLEHAIYATSIKSVPTDASRFGRVYFGAEFCQWRMPAASVVVKAYRRACDAGLSFTLLTPWVTDAGLAKAGRVLDGLAAAAGGERIEVVVNDFGLLELLASGYPGFVPALGRLLVRQKRCPRIPGIMEGLPDSGRDVYLHAGIEDAVTAKYLKGFGVVRAELDNPLQGIETALAASGLSGSIYTPYAYVTVTRHCPASFDGSTWQAFTGCRIKGCTSNTLSLANPAHEPELMMRGNAQFVAGPDLPAGLEEMGIDRVVHMEELP